MKCQTDGCNEEATVICSLPSFEEGKEDLTEHLCVKHAEESGYCIYCGGFWAGCESYDFSSIKGVCENCICEFEEPEPEDDYLEYDDFSDLPISDEQD